MSVKTAGMSSVPGEYAALYKQVYSISPRSIFRYATLSGLATFYKISGQIFSALSRDRIQFLYLHHVFEDEEDSFRKLLRLLSRNHFFISYSEAVNRIWTGRIDKPYISISFDDGLRSCLRGSRRRIAMLSSLCWFRPHSRTMYGLS